MAEFPNFTILSSHYNQYSVVGAKNEPTKMPASKFGNYELEEITGLDRRTIQDYKTVSDRTAVRHADLGFSHHREVAKLPPEKQNGQQRGR